MHNILHGDFLEDLDELTVVQISAEINAPTSQSSDSDSYYVERVEGGAATRSGRGTRLVIAAWQLVPGIGRIDQIG